MSFIQKKALKLILQIIILQILTEILKKELHDHERINSNKSIYVTL